MGHNEPWDNKGGLGLKAAENHCSRWQPLFNPEHLVCFLLTPGDFYLECSNDENVCKYQMKNRITCKIDIFRFFHLANTSATQLKVQKLQLKLLLDSHWTYIVTLTFGVSCLLAPSVPLKPCHARSWPTGGTWKYLKLTLMPLLGPVGISTCRTPRTYRDPVNDQPGPLINSHTKLRILNKRGFSLQINA